MEKLTIGQLAEASGVHLETIRYYERIGLIRNPPRTASGYRVYETADLARLRFIRCGRELGFEIEAIRKLLALQAAPDASCAQARAVTQAHVEAINTKVKQLLWMKEWLLRVIELCPSDASIDDCPILKAMACGTDHYAASTYCSK